MQSEAVDGRHVANRSLSLPGTDALGGVSAQPWDHVGITTEQQLFGFSSRPTAVVKKHGECHTKPQLKRPLADFVEHWKTIGDICRQFLGKIAAEFQKERRSLEDTKQYHHVIEAACFLRARMFASHIQDAGRDEDKNLIQTIWDILQSNIPRFSSTHLTQADLDQIQAFLVGPSEIETIMSETKDVEMVADQSTVPSTPARSFNDGASTADAHTGVHSSFTDNKNAPFPAMAPAYSDQPEFPSLDCSQAPPQMFPPTLPQHAADLQFMPTAQTYIGPHIYRDFFDVYQPSPLGWHDNPQLYGFFGGPLYSEASLPETMAVNIGPQDRNAFGLPDTTQMILQDQRNVNTAIAPAIPYHTKRNHGRLAPATQTRKRSVVRPKARPRRHRTKSKTTALMVSATGKDSVDDVFVDEFPSSIMGSPRKRRKVTAEGQEAEADMEMLPEGCRFQTPVKPGISQGQSDKLLIEGKL